MNEKGVCIALLAVPETDCDMDPEKVTLNTTTAIRPVLDKAANVDEAVELLNQVGVIGNEGTNKLQWSVVYNLSEQSGRIWPHRSSEDGWDFKIPTNVHPVQ